MLMSYPACFYKEENGYSVIFPDLNNTATCGDTLDEAMAMAIDCLAGYLYTLQQEDDLPPLFPPFPLQMLQRSWISTRANALSPSSRSMSRNMQKSTLKNPSGKP